MFVCSMKFSKRKTAAFCALVIGAAAVFGILHGSFASAPRETAVNGVVFDSKVKDNDSRVEYLKGFGWEVETEPESIEEIVIPQEFNQVFERYNQVQKLQGFDLEKQKGKRVKRYTYVVTNYPGETQTVRANLLICKERVVGGDICSLRAENGFLHGFALAEDTISMTPFSIS